MRFDQRLQLVEGQVAAALGDGVEDFIVGSLGGHVVLSLVQ